MQVQDWLKTASDELADSLIPSARLDAEIILAHTLNKPRTWLHAHTDEEIDPRKLDIANARLQLRLERVPIAYIVGHKDFYGRRFMVTPATLIPRPESEALIELLKKYMPKNAKHLVDVGTGSGCLGITAKLEYPALDVSLLDTSKQALLVAEKNCLAHDVSAHMVSSDLLAKYPFKADIVIANLPYVDTSWDVSPETNAEPPEALYADDNGLALILKLIDQIPFHTAENTLVLLEADPRQHQQIID